jgi:hypothetical protein
MKAQPLVIALTVVNLALVLVNLARSSSPGQQAERSVLRARAIELAGEGGQIRAQLTVESNGEAVFRMRDAKGTVRVKLGASEDGSGLVLLNESTEPGVHILAKREGGTSLTLKGKGGQQRVFTP